VPRVRELVRALELQVATVQALETTDLDLGSRCEGWTIREVLNHSLGVTRKFADFAAGLTDEPHAPPGDLLSPDYKTVVASVAEGARAAWSTVDMSRTCRLPFGTFRAETAAGINLFDTLAHTWDIADAISIDLDQDNDLWTVGLDAARKVIGSSRDPKQYAAQILTADDASAMHRFLAYLGRPVRDRP